YGLKLGSQIFIKHITETGLAAKNNSLQEGDLILKINGVISENMSLEETRQLIEQSEGKLTLLVLRDNSQFLVNIPQVRDSDTESSHLDDPEESPTDEYNFGGNNSMTQNDGISGYSPDLKVVRFVKAKNIGLRLTGGNDVGIFVSGVQEGSPAEMQGIQEGDQILRVNEKPFQNLTREDAVQYLMELLPGEEVTFHVQNKQDIVFDPRAEQFASLESVLKTTSKTSNALGARAEFWKLRGLRGAKRMLRKSREDLSTLTKQGHYPPYEKVVLKEATFKRPVVILGPIADIAMQKLSTEMPDQFQIAERLNYVQYFPIVVFCEPDSRQGIKAMRQWLVPDSKKSSRRLYAQATKMQKYCSHLFTATISLAGGSNNWYQTLKEIIQIQQARPVWMTEEQVDASAEESLDILNQTSAISMGDLTCDSRANSDYEETDAEGEAYTDQELDEPYQEAALSLITNPKDSGTAIMTSGINFSFDAWEYEHEALRRKFTHAQTYDSESDQDYGYDWGPATDL
ncbi:Tight junction protein ZO-3, partial [Ophiophagus hannah]